MPHVCPATVAWSMQKLVVLLPCLVVGLELLAQRSRYVPRRSGDPISPDAREAHLATIPSSSYLRHARRSLVAQPPSLCTPLGRARAQRSGLSLRTLARSPAALLGDTLCATLCCSELFNSYSTSRPKSSALHRKHLKHKHLQYRKPTAKPATAAAAVWALSRWHAVQPDPPQPHPAIAASCATRNQPHP